MVLFPARLPQAERERMEGYLAWKHGLQANLPSGHPYENAAPTVEPLWTPAETTTKLWLDADDESTLTETGGNVSEWRDKSGNGYAYAGTGAEQPVLDSSGVTDGLVFNGSSTKLEASGSAPNNTDSGDIFVVLNRALNSNIIPLGNTPNGEGYPVYWFSDNVIYTAYSSGSIQTASQVTLSGDVVVSASSDSGSKEIYANGVIRPQGGGPFPTSLQALNAVGFRLNNDTGIPEYSNGVIKEIVFFDAKLPEAERQRMEGYLAWKHGIESNLPADHPYKNAAPTIDVPPPPPPGPTIISNINVGTAAVAGQTYISAKRYS